MRIGRLYGLALVALLAIGTGLPPLVTLFGRAELPWTEKRRIAPAPALPATLAAWEAFPPAFEAFWSDVFGLRGALLGLDSALTKTLLGRLPTNKVVEGRDGWLFYAAGRSLDLYRRALPLGESDLATLAEERRRRADRLAARGIAYLMVIAPDKHTIRADKMPSHLRRRAGPSQLDQVAERMKAAGVPFLDLRPALLDAQRREETYFRLDTHWNAIGAHAAHAAILAALGRPPVPRPAFVETTSEGDLAVMAGLPAIERTPGLPPGGVGACDPTVEPPTTPGGPRRYRCAGENGRLLLYADSFGEGLVPWLARAFAETTLAGPAPLWTRLLADVERERPDVVVELRVEREIADVIETSIRSAE